MSSLTTSDAAVRSDKFEETQFLRDLVNLKDTQEAIQSLSTWCLKNRRYAYKIARCWLKVARKVRTDQRLTLFYLINDVVQNAKRKGVSEVVDKCQGVLKEAMGHFQDDKIAPKVKRCLDIWREREVFEDKFIAELEATLDPGNPKSKEDEQEIVDSFQPNQLCTQLKIMKALEDDTDYKLKTLKERERSLLEADPDARRENLKDRQHGNDFIGDFEEGRKRMEGYIRALEKEIAKRRQVVELLTQGKKYYDSLQGEAEIVATAYSNFSKRVKLQRGRLESKAPDLERRRSQMESISPIPSPDYDAPSPQAADVEMELELPEEVPDRTAASGGGGDLNSRLDTFIQNVQSGHRTSSIHSAVTTPPPKSTSISEYLTKLASGEHQPEDQGGIPGLGDSQAGYRPSQGWDYTGTADWQGHSWPAPQPDQGGAEPVPEWQLAPVDEEPPDEAPHDAAGPNIALARLAAKKAEDNLISLTNDLGGRNNAAGPERAQRNNSGGANRGSVDMDLDDDEDTGFSGPGGIPLPGEFTAPPPSIPSNGHSHTGGGGGRPSLQDRLRSLAGQPAAAVNEEAKGPPPPSGLEDRLHQRPPPQQMQGPPPAAAPLHQQMQVPPPHLAGPPPPVFNRGGPPPQPMRGRGGRSMFPRVIRGVDRGRGADRGGGGDSRGGFRGGLAGPFSPGFKGDPSLGLRGLPPDEGGPPMGGGQHARGMVSRGGPPRGGPPRGGPMRGGRGGRGRGRW